MTGFVSFVGSGPGDPQLLTLKALSVNNCGSPGPEPTKLTKPVIKLPLQSSEKTCLLHCLEQNLFLVLHYLKNQQRKTIRRRVEIISGQILSQPDDVLFSVVDSSDNAVQETGSVRGNVTGTFFHLIAEAIL